MEPPAGEGEAGNDRPPSQHASARLSYALAAADISDYAAAVVPTSGDKLATPGSFITQARRARTMALDLLVRAVMLERARGNSWKQIAHAYGQSEEWVKARYGPVEAEWLQLLNGGPVEDFETIDMATLIKDLPISDDEIHDTAARLDEWCDQRRDRNTPTQPALRLVSDGLAG